MIKTVNMKLIMIIIIMTIKMMLFMINDGADDNDNVDDDST